MSPLAHGRARDLAIYSDCRVLSRLGGEDYLPRLSLGLLPVGPSLHVKIKARARTVGLLLAIMALLPEYHGHSMW